MNKYSQIYSILLLFIFISSCKGQIKTDQPKDDNSQANKSNPLVPKSDSADYDPYFIESTAITTSYGPNSITRNILQDRNGNFWFASWQGIIRYDGTSFTNYTNKEGLRRFHVFSVLEDKTGNIWFGTIRAGVYRYDGKTFTNFTTKEGLADNIIGCIFEDKTGNIWFGTGGGVSRYDGNSFTNFTTKDGLSNNDINSIIEDKTGKLWFGTRGDACFYDGNTFTNFTNKNGVPFRNVRSIIEDKKGNIWLGGNDGLWRYDGSSFTNFTTDFVGYIYEDNKGNIWTGTDEANTHHWELSRYDEKLLSLGQTKGTKILKEDGQIFGILEDTNGNIWFGTEKGVCRYDGKAFNYFKDKETQE